MQLNLNFSSVEYLFSQFMLNDKAKEIIAMELRLPKHCRKNISKFVENGLIKDKQLPYSFSITNFKKLNK